MSIDNKRLKSLGLQMVGGRLVELNDFNDSASKTEKVEKRVYKLKTPDEFDSIKQKPLKPTTSTQPNKFYSYLTDEDKLNIEVGNYLTNQYPDVLWWHTPNEGKRTNFERYKAVLLGMKKGVPDITIAEPKFIKKNNGLAFVYAGLYIELKVEREKVSAVRKNKTIQKSRASDSQKDFLEILNKKRYKAVICYNFNEAKKIIDEYLKK